MLSPQKVTPIPSEVELLIQRLIGNARPVPPAPTGSSGFTDMEAWIQNLLPVWAIYVRAATLESRTPGLVGCGVFSCGKPGHAASRCPTLDVTFPFLLPGWQAEKVGGGFVMQSPRMLAERLRTENGN